MSKELDDLTQQVANTLAVEESAINLITGLAAQIKANANDPAAITALSDQLNAEAAKLAAAITANTASTTTTTPAGN